MISPAALEEAVLALLCFSDEAQKVAMHVSADLFSTRVNHTLAEAALKYIHEYHNCPGSQLEYLLEVDLRRGEEGKLLGLTLDTIRKQSPDIQIDFVLGQLERFVDIQRLKIATQNAMEQLHVGDLEAARQSIFGVGAEKRNVSEGLWLHDFGRVVSKLQERTTEFISCGVPCLDVLGITLRRKTLSFMLASTGMGKSWWLIEVGKSALLQHHSVLHITLELDQDETAKRYIQAFFSLTDKEAKGIQVTHFDYDSQGNLKFEMSEIVRDSIVNRKNEIRERIARMRHWPRFMVKEFPTSTLSTDQLSMFLDTLEKKEHFKPDVILIDYADLMKLDSESLRIDTGRLYRELRGIGMQRNIAIATASQGNRDSKGAKVVDTDMVAEDWSKIGTADLVLTYSQTKEEFQRGLARVFAAKVRDAGSRRMSLISQAYDCGQFCLDSVLMNAQVAEESKNAAR